MKPVELLLFPVLSASLGQVFFKKGVLVIEEVPLKGVCHRRVFENGISASRILRVDPLWGQHDPLASRSFKNDPQLCLSFYGPHLCFGHAFSPHRLSGVYSNVALCGDSIDLSWDFCLLPGGGIADLLPRHCVTGHEQAALQGF
jgi:hypothetical protein